MGYEQLYQYYKALGLSDEEARASARRMSGQPEETRQPTGERPGGFATGLGYGAKETGAAHLGGLGYGLDLLGIDDAGKGLQQAAERVKLDEPELTGAGKAGRFIGRLGTEILGTALVGGAALRGLSTIPRVAKALSGASRLQRGVATAAANLPVDVAQALAYREGMVLPGTAGALAENIALSGGLGAVLPAVKPSQRAARAIERSDRERELAEAVGEFTGRVERSRATPDAGPPREFSFPEVRPATPEETAVYSRPRRGRDTQRVLERASRIGEDAAARRLDLPFRTAEPEGIVVPSQYSTRSPQKQAGAMRRIRNVQRRVDQISRVERENAQIAARLEELNAQRRAGELDYPDIVPSVQAPGGISPAEVIRRRAIREQAGVGRRQRQQPRPAQAVEEAAQQAPEVRPPARPDVPGIIQPASVYRPRSPERVASAQQDIRRLLTDEEIARAADDARRAREFEQSLIPSATATRRVRRQAQFDADEAQRLSTEQRLQRAMGEGAEEAAARARGERGLDLYSFPGPVLQNQGIQSLLGGVVGATAGSELDEDGGFTGTLLGGLAGLAAPALARKIMRKADELPSLQEAVKAQGSDLARVAQRSLIGTPTKYERGLLEGTVGRPRTQPEINASTLSMDPTGDILYGQTLRGIASSGRTVGDREVAALAKDVGIDKILSRGKVNLDTVEIAALADSIKAADSYRKTVVKMLEGLPSTASNETREALEAARDRVTDYLTNYYLRLDLAGSEKGRALRYLQVAATNTNDLPGYLRLAKQFLGAEKIDDRVRSRIASIFNLDKPDDEKARELVKFLSQNRKAGVMQVLSDFARWSLLTAPASFMRNFVGGVEAVTGRVADTVFSDALDKIATGRGGVPVTSMASVPKEARRYLREVRRQQGFGPSFVRQSREELKPFLEFRENGFKGIYERFGSGIDPEDPFNAHALNRAMYESFVNNGNSEWMKSLTPAAKAFDAMRNTVYGMLAAQDRPFYRASFNGEMVERAMLRAISEGVEPASEQFASTVRRYADINSGEARPLDVFMAGRKALEDTFKTQTGIGSAIRSLGRVGGPSVQAAGEFLIPFANTPTNIVRKALERVPLIGQGIGAVRAGNLENKLLRMQRQVDALRSAGVNIRPQDVIRPEDIQRELTKFRREVLARQVTGSTMIMIGYVLHKAGLLTPQYAPSVGASGEEREELQRQRLTNSGPVSLEIMGNSLNIASLGISAPLLAIGAAISQADESDEPVGVLEKVGIGARSAVRTAQEMPLLRGLEDVRSLASGQIDAGEYAGRQARRFVPASALTSTVARALDPEVGKREPEGFVETVMEGIPLLRETLPARVSPLGEVAPAPNPLLALLSPFTPRRTAEGPLYGILEDLELYPSPGRKLEDETERQYSERRQLEGVAERDALMQAYELALQAGIVNEEELATDPAARERLRKFMERALRRTRSRASSQRAMQQTGANLP